MNRKYPTTSGRVVIKNRAYNSNKYYVLDIKSKMSGYANEDSKNLLLLCDGTRTVDGIVDILAGRHKNTRKEIEDMVKQTIKYFQEINIIRLSDVPDPNEITVRQNDMEWSLDLVYLEVTNRCNLSCTHCYAEANEAKTNEMTKEQIFNIIDQLEEIGVLEIIITGGEALVRDDIFDIMEYIVEKKIDFSLFTNSLLLNEEKSKRIKELNPRMVAVSLDSSNAEINDKVRGKGTFEKTIKGVKMLLKEGVNVRINSTIINNHNESEKELRGLLEFIDEMGIKNIAIGTFVTYGRGEKEMQMIPPLRAARDVVKILEDIHKKGNKDKPVLKFYDTFMGKTEREFDKHSICGIGTYSCSIKPNGDIGLCTVLNAKNPVSVIGNSIKEIWANFREFEQFRKVTVDDIEKCKDCELKYKCLGGCKATSLMFNKKINSPDLWMCASYGV